VSSHQRMRAVIIIVTAADACDARLIACGDCYHGSERVQCTSYVMRTSRDNAWCSYASHSEDIVSSHVLTPAYACGDHDCHGSECVQRTS
jgi:hypothetical protein